MMQTPTQPLRWKSGVLENLRDRAQQAATRPSEANTPASLQENLRSGPSNPEIPPRLTSLQHPITNWNPQPRRGGLSSESPHIDARPRRPANAIQSADRGRQGRPPNVKPWQRYNEAQQHAAPMQVAGGAVNNRRRSRRAAYQCHRIHNLQRCRSLLRRVTR